MGVCAYTWFKSLRNRAPWVAWGNVKAVPSQVCKKHECKQRTHSFSPKEQRLHLLGIRVFNLPGRQYIPVCVHTARCPDFIIHQNDVAGIRLDNECIDMCKMVSFALQIFFKGIHQAFVLNNGMDLFHLCATNVRPKHDTVNTKSPSQ